MAHVARHVPGWTTVRWALHSTQVLDQRAATVEIRYNDDYWAYRARSDRRFGVQGTGGERQGSNGVWRDVHRRGAGRTAGRAARVAREGRR